MITYNINYADNFSINEDIQNRTDFLKAFLICFFNIKKIVDKIILENKNNNDKSSLIYLFKGLEENSINLTEDILKNIIDKKNNNTKYKDLISFFIRTLNKELNKIESKINELKINLKDKENGKKMFWHYLDLFKKENKSIISDCLFETILKKSKCPNCNKIFFDYEIYYLFSFSLLDVYNYKNSRNNQIMNNIISIVDCFNFHRKEEKFIKCDICSNSTKFKIIKQLYCSIDYLIISLCYDKKKIGNLDLKFEISEKFSLYDFILVKPEKKFNYELIGVVTLLNENENVKNKKFIAYFKNFVDNKWNCYNDGKVDSIENFNDEIKSKCKPYYLFYAKDN
jgi:hypothetical protein